MRTILRGKAELVGIAHAEIDPVELIRAAPDWEVLDEDGFKTTELRALFADLEAAAARRKRRLPTHLDDPLLAELIDKPVYRTRPDLPLAITNALLILCQVPPDERNWTESARWLKVAAHHQLHSFAVIFAFGERGRTFEVRTRSDRRRDLEMSTEAIATALMSRTPFTFEPAPGSIGAEREAGRVVTRFDPVKPVEMKDVNGHEVATGRIVELRGWLAIARRAYFAIAPTVLNALGVILTGFSLWFYIESHGAHNAWNFFDGLSGRLATAAFGAALIAGTERAIDLRGRMRDTDGRARFAAVIDWSDQSR